MTRFRPLGIAALAAAIAGLAHLTAAPPISDADFVSLRKVIRPGDNEDAFATIPWEADLWDARKKAAAAGKPVFLWEMDGSPLGCG